MKFKTDENLPLDAAATLREAGFDVQTVWDEGLAGAGDEIVAKHAQDEQRVLITLDLDFASIQSYPPDRFAGIVVLRAKAHDRTTVVSFLRRLIPVLQNRNPSGELWIVQRDRVRFRQSG